MKTQNATLRECTRNIGILDRAFDWIVSSFINMDKDAEAPLQEHRYYSDGGEEAGKPDSTHLSQRYLPGTMPGRGINAGI